MAVEVNIPQEFQVSCFSILVIFVSAFRLSLPFFFTLGCTRAQLPEKSINLLSGLSSSSGLSDSLCCVLAQDTQPSQCLFPPRGMNQKRLDVMATSQNEGVGLGEQGQQEKQLANLLDV